MFTVHCTRKLLDRVKAPAVEACEPTTLLGNWYATALFWKPRQVALIVNEKTLLPVFVPLAPASSLGDRIGEAVGLVLEALGVGIDVVLQETAEMVDVSFAKTANRSVIGSMNEFAYHAEFRNSEGWDDLTAIATDLADMPCGPLYKTYVTPRDALHAAIGEATGHPPQPGGRFGLQGDHPVERIEPPGMLIADLSHYDDMPNDAAAELVALAAHLQSITSVATSRSAGRPWSSALPCISSAVSAKCNGHVVVDRSDVPASIEWRCSNCGDAGTISGWQTSVFDLRHTASDQIGGGERVQVTVPAEVIPVLRSVLILDPDCERMVNAATTTDRGVEISGEPGDFEQLIGFVASEANHEEDPKRVRVLDSCLDTLSELFGDLR